MPFFITLPKASLVEGFLFLFNLSFIKASLVLDEICLIVLFTTGYWYPVPSHIGLLSFF